jgi:6-phosphogluconate dehydrogenase
MKIGFIGLGRMGGNMVERLIGGDHEIIAYDRDEGAVKAAAQKGATGANSVASMTQGLAHPRAVWIMVPAGPITTNVIDELSACLEAGDIIIDGGNSYYADTMKRADALRKQGILFLDAGTSGGIWGLKEGYCLMVGGEEAAFKIMEPVFKTLAPENGYGYMGKNGSGHFVKMVHNGIEYAMLQAYGEGFEILKAKNEFGLDLRKVSRLWNHGSVVRSWILELCGNAFEKDPGLDSIRGYVDDSGEGRWTVFEAIHENVPAPVITLSLLQRIASRQEGSFSAKLIAALRNEFGGHAVKKK